MTSKCRHEKRFQTSVFIPTAKTHRGGENQQVAEDAEELGQIQEQRQGEQLCPSAPPDEAQSDASTVIFSVWHVNQAVIHIAYADKCSFS